MAPATKRSFLFRAIRIVILVYVGMLVLLAGCQRRYIYFPERAGENELLAEAQRYGVEAWRDEENRLIGWKAPAPGGSGPIRQAVVFHGNAGMAIHRTHYAEGLQATSGDERWAVYIFEYPGYGSRPGAPGEDAFYEAARDALRELFPDREAGLVLIGESLGTGVASRMAAEFPDRVDGVLLVTPYTTLADVGARHFRWLPVGLLLRDRYDNVAALEEYRGPVAFLLAENDEVIPAELGRELYEGYDGLKKLWIQEGRGHNTLDLSSGLSWWDEVTRFLMEEDES